jgi:hypothetical protein
MTHLLKDSTSTSLGAQICQFGSAAADERGKVEPAPIGGLSVISSPSTRTLIGKAFCVVDMSLLSSTRETQTQKAAATRG